MHEEKSLTKSLLLIVGFIAVVAAVAGAVYGVFKYIEKKQTDEFMDYYFDDDEDYDEFLEEAQTDEDVVFDAPEEA